MVFLLICLGVVGLQGWCYCKCYWWPVGDPWGDIMLWLNANSCQELNVTEDIPTFSVWSLNEYRILTQNIGVTGTASKRYKIHSLFTRIEAHIVFLQETHQTNIEVTNYSNDGWANSSVPCSLRMLGKSWCGCTTQNPNRRYVKVKGHLDGLCILLDSIYALNMEQEA